LRRGAVAKPSLPPAIILIVRYSPPRPRRFAFPPRARSLVMETATPPFPPRSGAPAMKKPSAKVLEMMTTAAQLRALGISWESIAAKLGRDESSCRRWTERHPGEWKRLLTPMEEAALRQAGNEALHVLKRAMAGKGDPLAAQAARFLYGKQREAKARWRQRRRDALADKYSPFIAYLESLDAEQRKALVA